MRLLSFVLFLWVSLSGWAEAQQSPIVIERLEISLWPEYDDPRLLVIYRGVLAQEPKGPLTFAIPITAELHAVAYLNAEGRLLKSDWQILPGSDREQLVVFTPGSRQFQLEYYEEIATRGPQRSFTFQFQSSRYEIGALQLEVQQPLRSRDFVAQPPLPDDLGTDTRGLRYFGRKFGTVPLGVLIEQQISYTKRDAQPSVQANTGEVFSLSWPVVGALTLLVLGLVGITWYWWAQRRTPPSPGLRHPSLTLPVNGEGTGGVKGRGAGFCSGCGYAFRDEEAFCPKCGRPRATQ